MSKLFYKAMVEDVQNDRCSDAELEALLNTFEYAVKQVAVTLIREAKFELKDFATSKKCGISGFDLRLEKHEVHDQTQWWGTFTYGHKKLKVIGTLEA